MSFRQQIMTYVIIVIRVLLIYVYAGIVYYFEM